VPAGQPIPAADGPEAAVDDVQVLLAGRLLAAFEHSKSSHRGPFLTTISKAGRATHVSRLEKSRWGLVSARRGVGLLAPSSLVNKTSPSPPVPAAGRMVVRRRAYVTRKARKPRATVASTL
jgi:hypothetical protein